MIVKLKLREGLRIARRTKVLRHAQRRTARAKPISTASPAWSPAIWPSVIYRRSREECSPVRDTARQLASAGAVMGHAQHHLGRTEMPLAGATLHYGPPWFWDQSRPEAIEARRQMEASYRAIRTAQRRGSASPESRVLSQNPRATRSRQAEARPLSALDRRGLSKLPICADPAEAEAVSQKARCASSGPFA